jgi:[acyl-carrier-protein] S-malonyltransferase
MSVAWIFPGQGAQSLQMLDGVRASPSFGERYGLICDALDADPLARDPASIDRNAVSSLLTVLTSSLSLELLRRDVSEEPIAVAGYSVGQWTALHAAGRIDFATLVRIVKRRAELMDACFETRPGAMLAVIGLAESVVASAIEAIRVTHPELWISNVNCVGQYSIAGTVDAIDEAERQIAVLSPKKLARIPVSGAWHCPLLRPAADAFRDVLREVAITAPAIPVIDNVTGAFLPRDPAALTEQLCRHLDHPVLWAAGVKTLVAAGATEIVEVGFGNTLTKFGFFVDRSVKHSTFYNGSPVRA